MSEIAELLERYRRGAELLAVVTTGAAGSMLDYSPAPGKWSIRQIVCHLADTEMVIAFRMRAVIAEDSPRLGAFNQDAWAANLDYARRKFSHALESFRRVRAENYELLKELPEATFERKGIHDERGPLTLLDLLRGAAGHTEKHAEQIAALREAYKASKSASV